MVKVVAKQLIKADQVEAFKEIALELVAMTRSYDVGCLDYTLLQDMQNEKVYTFIEEWETMEALKLHMEARHFKNLFPKLEPFYEKPIEVSLYKIIES